MEFIAHRVNTVEELRLLPVCFGVELDLRDYNGHLILQHDPFEPGEFFEDYLKCYNHGTMILNIKSERIEYDVLGLLQKYAVSKYFFLDSSFPMINLLSSQGENRIALRYSEYEGLDTIVNMQNKCEWVWVDCFSRLPITKEIEEMLHRLGYKICLVSPELQGRQKDLLKYKKTLAQEEIVFDAICTKYYNIEVWGESL